MAKKIRIGIDVDGTLTEYYQFFMRLTNSFPDGKFYIITGRGEEFKRDTENELKLHHIKYDGIYYVEEDPNGYNQTIISPIVSTHLGTDPDMSNWETLKDFIIWLKLIQC